MVNKSYWYDVASGSVLQAEERGDGWLGPFATAEEAEEAPQTFIAHANEWLNSVEGQHFLDIAKAEQGEPGTDL